MSIQITVPETAVVSEHKVRDYLLKPQQRNDKSVFLNRAGYSQEHWQVLYADIRSLLPTAAELQSENQYGKYYFSLAELTGPNGLTVRVRRIWLLDLESSYRFVTLIPLTSILRQ
jgi:hypothetical protein